MGGQEVLLNKTMKEHKYKTIIHMDKPLKRQIAKLIKEKKEFDSDFEFNPHCNCEKCQVIKRSVLSK